MANEAFEVDRRQLVAGRQPDDQIAMDRDVFGPPMINPHLVGVRMPRRALDLAGVAHFDSVHLAAQ